MKIRKLRVHLEFRILQLKDIYITTIFIFHFFCVMQKAIFSRVMNLFFIHNHGWNLYSVDAKNYLSNFFTFIRKLATPSEDLDSNQQFHSLRNRESIVEYSLSTICIDFERNMA